jgi:Tfp pilus assembly protein PilN
MTYFAGFVQYIVVLAVFPWKQFLYNSGIEEKTTRLAFLKQELEQMSKDITKTLNYKETVSMEIQQALQYIEQNQQSFA